MYFTSPAFNAKAGDFYFVTHFYAPNGVFDGKFMKDIEIPLPLC